MKNTTTLLFLLLVFASMSVSYAQNAANGTEPSETETIGDPNDKPSAPREFLKVMSQDVEGKLLNHQTYYGSKGTDAKVVYWRKGRVIPATLNQERALEEKGYAYVNRYRTEAKRAGDNDALSLFGEIEIDLRADSTKKDLDVNVERVKPFPDTDYHQVWNDATGRVCVMPFGSNHIFSFDSWERAQEYLQPKTGKHNLRYGKPETVGSKQLYSFDGDILPAVGSAPGIFKCKEIRDERIVVLPAAEIAGNSNPSADKTTGGNGDPKAVPISPKAILILASEESVPDRDLWMAFIGAGNEWKPKALEANAFKRLRSVASVAKAVDAADFGKFSWSQNGSIELKPSWMWQFEESDEAFQWKPTNSFQLKVISGAATQKPAGKQIGPCELFFGDEQYFANVTTKASKVVDLFGKMYLPRSVTLSNQNLNHSLTFVRISNDSESYLLNQELTVGQVVDLLEFIENTEDEIWRYPERAEFAKALLNNDSGTGAFSPEAQAEVDRARQTADRSQKEAESQNPGFADQLGQSNSDQPNPLAYELQRSWTLASSLGMALKALPQSLPGTSAERHSEFTYWAWLYLQLQKDINDLPPTSSSNPLTPDAWRDQVSNDWKEYQLQHRLHCLENYIGQRSVMWAQHSIEPEKYDLKTLDAEKRFRTKVKEFLGQSLGEQFELTLDRYIARHRQLSPRTLTVVVGPHPFEEPVVLWTPKMVTEVLRAVVVKEGVGNLTVDIPYHTEWTTARGRVANEQWNGDKLGFATVPTLATVPGWSDFTDSKITSRILNLAGNLHEFVQGPLETVKSDSNPSPSKYIVGDSFRTNGWGSAAVPCNNQTCGTDIGVRLALRAGIKEPKEPKELDEPQILNLPNAKLRNQIFETLYGVRELPGLLARQQPRTIWENQVFAYRRVAGEHVYWIDELIRAVMYADSSKYFEKAQTPSNGLLEKVRVDLYGDG